MDKQKRTRVLVIAGLILAALLCAVIALARGHTGGRESIQEAMKDAVLHETGKVSLFGLVEVNPAVAAGFVLTCILLFAALLIRLFAVPRFREVPGKAQLLLETAVGYFDGLAKTNSPHRHGFLSFYLFAAGVYIFLGTLLELFGLQAVSTAGRSISLPAPLSDINAALAMGLLSYGVILVGGLRANGLRGAGAALKDFSLPISMSFRLFGALLSGLLVTELVYYTLRLSFVIPVFVGIMFTLLHALIQTYVLTMLVSVFYGECTEPHAPKEKKQKRGRAAVKDAETAA
ncbi:MAG: F0F1 ATP synthase subunit A [Lachnospiraceae bacterium]|nr:F0F1 ATP synthase subunit A [Lachnospiraceae bacterium]